MRRVVFGGLVLATLSLAGVGSALAAVSYDGSPIAQKIHLAGHMPEIRMIYVDRQQHIISVVTNTTDNVAPIIALPGSPDLLPLSPYINQQYQRILDSQGGHLRAGTYYPVKPPYVPAMIKLTDI